MEYTVGILIGLIVGAGATMGLVTRLGRNALARARAEGERLVTNARQQAENQAKQIELTARQDQLKAKEKFERDLESSRKKLDEQEQRLAKREDTLDKKLETLGVKERHLDELNRDLTSRERVVKEREADLAEVLRQQKDRLLSIAGFSAEQARELLLRRIEDECRGEAGAIIQRVTEQANEEARDKARHIILQAIQRYAAEQTAAA
jgi:ribonuclease Y